MIKEIKIHNFRCIQDLSIKCSNLNLIYGKNAQGKTSIIEAIYFLATGRSFRTKKNKDLIQKDKLNAVVFGLTNSFDKHSIIIDNDKRKIYLNGNQIPYLEHIGKIYITSLVPDDTHLITGSPSDRRAFFNYEISQINKLYLDKVVEYQKILKLRNMYLKTNSYDDKLRSIYEDKYITLNYEISYLRKKYTEKLNEVLEKKYKELFNVDQIVNIKYKPNISDISSKEKIKEFLLSKKDYESMYKTSLYGVHKDDYQISINNLKAQIFTSQGEQKSIIAAIKISQIHLNEKKEAVFLIDDINAFFDINRRKDLVNYCINNKIQLFITATEDQKLDGKIFYVFEGRIENDRKI